MPGMWQSVASFGAAFIAMRAYGALGEEGSVEGLGLGALGARGLGLMRLGFGVLGLVLGLGFRA